MTDCDWFRIPAAVQRLLDGRAGFLLLSKYLYCLMHHLSIRRLAQSDLNHFTRELTDDCLHLEV